MERLIESYLRDWTYNTRRKPLIIRGARQVGKTWIVDKLGKDNFKYYLKVNPEKERGVKSIFQSRDPKLIISELSALYNTPVIENETLLFIDEVQLLPDAIATLRYFYEDYPGLHVITAGSLLDHTLNDLPYSMPVGRVEYAYLYPLNFVEFLMAAKQEGLLSYLNRYSLGSPFSEAIHQKLTSWLRLYFFIGGMPEAVKTYMTTENMVEVEKVHSGILTSFQYDFSKYGSRNQQRHLNDCLEYAANNIGKKVKYVNINKNVHSGYLREALLKLERSRIVNLVRRTQSSKVPINQNVDYDVFKPVFLDIGLVCSLAGIKLTDIQNLVTDFEGALAEQFVAQELLTSFETYKDASLYYWAREAKNANAEVDFVFQIQNEIYPIEVKAGKTGTLKSLQMYLCEKNKDTGIRFNLDLPSIGKNLSSSVNIKGEMKKIHYQLLSFPLYFSGYLTKYVRKIPD
jgi:predicted AAA+ superfamily ATPase